MHCLSTSLTCSKLDLLCSVRVLSSATVPDTDSSSWVPGSLIVWCFSHTWRLCAVAVMWPQSGCTGFGFQCQGADMGVVLSCSSPGDRLTGFQRALGWARQ
jgi:hypothetical protein